MSNMRIAVAGTGYVGLSLAVLLAQHNHVTAMDIIPEKVEKINNRISPIQDEYIERFLSEDKNGEQKLDLTATLDAEAAYSNADFVIIAAPTNGWAKFSVRDNDKKNQLKINTLDGYRESDAC